MAREDYGVRPPFRSTGVSRPRSWNPPDDHLVNLRFWGNALPAFLASRTLRHDWFPTELTPPMTTAPPLTWKHEFPLNDVIDTSYSALAAGFAAFDTSTFHVGMGDGVDPHTDVSDTTFPFLGPPHS